ncbi:MAG: TIGR02266 family protein [Deltaproteobacteria bacterium]|nr:TIGR02266 family protein [Deltaproteobacteria bacterium]
MTDHDRSKRDDTDNADGRDAGDHSRDTERAPILLKVEYKRLNTFFYDYTKNISKGGTFIKTDRPLGIGTVFQFHLTVPVTSDPIQLRGEVRWVVRPGDPPSPDVPAGHENESGMGIRFVYGDPEERLRLERVVEKMMVNSLGQLAYARLFAPGTR